jgi:hypothetical protein
VQTKSEGERMQAVRPYNKPLASSNEENGLLVGFHFAVANDVFRRAKLSFISPESLVVYQ